MCCCNVIYFYYDMQFIIQTPSFGGFLIGETCSDELLPSLVATHRSSAPRADDFAWRYQRFPRVFADSVLPTEKGPRCELPRNDVVRVRPRGLEGARQRGQQGDIARKRSRRKNALGSLTPFCINYEAVMSSVATVNMGNYLL